MLSAWASAGTAHFPFGLPAGGSVSAGSGGGAPLVPLVPPDVVPPEVVPGPPLVEGSPLLVPPDELGALLLLEQP
jgi:hypothetical protein